ncbi:MAG: ABC transporter permease subunit [Alphaproteobacteria bacterium]|nr:ABC transporter permease subunit [Alphaproteobacteria bacterium]
MLAYTMRRVLGAVPTLLAVITLSFVLMHLAPGGPFDQARRLPPQIEHNIEHDYHLDEPLYRQYFLYLDNLAHFNFGASFKNRAFTVGQLIEIGLPVSARIGLSAIVLAILFGSAFGTLAALHHNHFADHGIMSIAMVGITLPNFVTAPILTLIFGIYGISLFGHHMSLPVGGWDDGNLRNLILPVTVLALPQMAIIARLVRGSMIEVLHSNYVRTARAKGLPARLVITRHALRAGLLPLVSYLGPAVASILTGSLVVEQIFGVPGIGRYFVQAAVNRDYTMVMGVVITYATLVIVLNLAADLLYGILDPRVRLQ